MNTSKPCSANDLEALPPDLYTEFFVNAHYLDTQGYQGISFIFGRVIHVSGSRPILFYRLYFEGISADDERYLSAQVEGASEFAEPLEAIADPDEYVAQAMLLFDNPVNDDIVEWIRQAESMFSSFDYIFS